MAESINDPIQLSQVNEAAEADGVKGRKHSPMISQEAKGEVNFGVSFRDFRPLPIPPGPC